MTASAAAAAIDGIFVGYYDPTGGKSIGIGFQTNLPGGIVVASFASVTSSPGAPANPTLFVYPQTFWLGLYNDGTTIHYQVSSDSVNWQDVYTESNSSGFLTAAYGHVAFWVRNSSLTTDHPDMTIRTWDESGTSRTLSGVYG